jgi:hypothetical protein
MAVNDDTSRKLTVRQAAFIGVGATVGAGIFSLLGAAGEVAGAAVWLSFLELARQPQEEPQLVGGEVELLEEAPVPEVERHEDLLRSLPCGWCAGSGRDASSVPGDLAGAPVELLVEGDGGVDQ